MKKTYFKDIITTISRQIIPYISIAVIGFIAVAAYFGINFSSAALTSNAIRFYQEHNFRDFEVTSTMLITPDDVEYLKGLDNIKDVEGVRQVSCRLNKDDSREKVYVTSLTKRINTVSVLKGRLPEKPTECVIEAELFDAYNMQIGDTITVTDQLGNTPGYLKRSEYTLTGSVEHPDHYAYKRFAPGDRYILVNDNAFDVKTLNGNYMKAIITADHSAKNVYLSKKYDLEMDDIQKELDAAGRERSALRGGHIKGLFQDAIDEKQAEADEGKQKLDDARALLDEGAAAISSAEQALAGGKEQLDQAASALSYGRDVLSSIRQALEAMQKRLSDARAELDNASLLVYNGAALLSDTYSQAAEIKDACRELMKEAVRLIIGSETADSIPWADPETGFDINDPGLSIGIFRITNNISVDLSSSLTQITANAIRQLLDDYSTAEEIDAIIEYITQQPLFISMDNKFQEIFHMLREWNYKHAEYLTGRAKYLEGEAQYAAGCEELGAGWEMYASLREQYVQKEAQYYSAISVYDRGITQLDQARTELTIKESEFSDGLIKYNKGINELEDARKKISDLPPCTWLTLDAKANGGYQHARSTADNLGTLGLTFALLFIVLGALVIYATISKLVEENRTLIGTQRAIGFFRREILAKYISFGSSATLAGMLIGTLFGVYVLQSVLLNSYKKFYVTGNIPFRFVPMPFIIVVLAGVILSAASVWFGCRRLLKESAKDLMQESPPASFKSKNKNKSQKGSLYSRLIMRNIITDKSRIIITIVSIAGSCVLLMIGFTLRNNIKDAVKVQFDEINKYKYTLSFDPNDSKDNGNEFRELLDENGISYVDVLSEPCFVKIGEDYDADNIVTAQSEDIYEAYGLRDADTFEPISLPESGVIIPRRLAEAHNMKEGDSITILASDLTSHDIEITDICDYYIGRSIFISENEYKEVFGRDAAPNRLCSNNIPDKDLISDKAAELDGFITLTASSETRSTYNSFLSALNLVTVILIFAAGLMSYFVLLNLINMHIRQKKRELTTMRINGFTVKEVIGYVSRESVVTTILGIILGVAVGAVLAHGIIRLLEQAHTGFVRSVNLHAVLFSVLISLAFTIFINFLALRKIKRLNLTDIE